MIITRKTIPRRTVLRGLGASLALPLLDGMVPAFAAVQNSPANPVRRLGVVYVPNGMRMEHWTPSIEGLCCLVVRIVKCRRRIVGFRIFFRFKGNSSRTLLRLNRLYWIKG